MANKCVVCDGPGAVRSFPTNSLPHKQTYWVQCLNLLPEEGERMLLEWREKQDKKQRVYWCNDHFGEGKDPIDQRPPKSSASIDNMPLLTRQLSEVSVNDGTTRASPAPTPSRFNSFPSPFRGDSASTPLPSRDTSEKTNNLSQELDPTVQSDELQYSSQETVQLENDDIISSPLPPYLLISSVQLLKLFKRCPECGLELTSSIKPFLTGSALVLKWNCDLCCAQSWTSQPKLNGRFFEGNVKLACSMHTTGLPLARLLDFGEELELALPAERTMRDYLSNLVIPAVNSIYSSHMQMVISTVRNAMNVRGLDLSMDGRYDSPGFSATNCTVSAIDLKTNLVVMVVNKHKAEKEIGNISGRMEKEGVRTGVKRIHALQLKIRTICTDNDAKIGKMLREDEVFKGIKHLLDFWHLIKGINHELREVSKKKSCSNVQYWRDKIINHAYFCHYKYGRNRMRGINYWKAVLPHVTGRHRGFHKIPFIEGITKCKHAKLGEHNENLIKRDSEEYQELKAVVLKPTFLSGFLRASPKTNTSPNESFNSIINMYAPKSRSCSPKWYAERVKLATMHFNTLALLSILNLRKERWNTSVNVNGRHAHAVKRKMTKAEHAWRNEVWKEIPGILNGRQLQQFLQRNNAPTDREYLLALQQEEEETVGDEEEEHGEGEADGEDGAVSDVSMELGGGVYGEDVDSDFEPTMKLIELSDVEDEKSEGEDEEEEQEVSSGSEWDEGEAGRFAVERGKRGRGRGRGGRGRWLSRGGTVAQSVVTTDKSTVLARAPANQEEGEPSTKEGKGEKREKRKVRRAKTARKVVMDESSSESESDKPPVKKGRGKD